MMIYLRTRLLTAASTVSFSPRITIIRCESSTLGSQVAAGGNLEAQGRNDRQQVLLTASMRDLRLKYEADLEDKRERIKSLQNDIKQLEKEIEYTIIAYRFLHHYTETGNLELDVNVRTPKALFVEGRVEPSDQDLFFRCFAKYGFESDKSLN